MTQTHWRKSFDYRFLSGEELEGETVVTIDRVTTEEIFDQSTNSKGKALAIYFKGAKKGIIVNKTNAKAISKVLGTPYTEKWVGGRIIIYPHKGKFFGEEMQVVRVKVQKPG